MAPILQVKQVWSFSQIKSPGESLVDIAIRLRSYCINFKLLQRMVRKDIVPPHRIGKLWKFRFIRSVDCTVSGGNGSRLTRWVSQDPNRGLLPGTRVSYPTFLPKFRSRRGEHHEK